MYSSLLSILFFTVFIFNGFKASAQDEEHIIWGTKTLSWNDFQGSIPENSDFHALTNSAINLVYDGENAQLRFTIETLFDLNGSWKKPGVDEHILQHEQLHFDITEYHSRILRKKLKSYRFKTYASIESDVKKLFNQAYTNAGKMQIKYDKSTNHSRNKKKQLKWNKKVKKLLRSMNSFKSTTFQINISYLTK